VFIITQLVKHACGTD